MQCAFIHQPLIMADLLSVVILMETCHRCSIPKDCALSMHVPGAGHYCYTNGLSAPTLSGFRTTLLDTRTSFLSAMSSPAVSSVACKSCTTDGPAVEEPPSCGDASNACSGSGREAPIHGAPGMVGESQTAGRWHSIQGLPDLPLSSSASTRVSAEKVCAANLLLSMCNCCCIAQSPWVGLLLALPNKVNCMTCRSPWWWQRPQGARMGHCDRAYHKCILPGKP